jgi:hypothetical protein
MVSFAMARNVVMANTNDSKGMRMWARWSPPPLLLLLPLLLLPPVPLPPLLPPMPPVPLVAEAAAEFTLAFGAPLPPTLAKNTKSLDSGGKKSW